MTTGSATPSPLRVFRDVAIPVSTRRTWIRGEVRPTVVSADTGLEIYDLLDQVQRLQTRVRMQAAIIALLMRVLRIRGGKPDLTRLPDGSDKSAILRTLRPASRLLGIDRALKVVGLSRARHYAWRRRDAGCGLDDEPSCPKSFPTRLTRNEINEMRNLVESPEYSYIAICNLAFHAQRLGKVVWMPPGTYYQNSRFILDGVSVEGAGMWHTALVGTVEGTTWAGNLGFSLGGDSARVANLYIDSMVHTARTIGGKAFTCSSTACTNWSVENVWITHAMVGFWMAGTNGVVRGCRVRSTYADGINVGRGAIGCLIENNHVRDSGDDGLALLSESANQSISTGNTLRFNSVLATRWAGNCDLAGGGDHVIVDNYFADSSKSGAFSINMPSAYPMYPLTGALIERNTIVRGGGSHGGQRRGAIWIYPGGATIENVIFHDNDIRVALFRGIRIVGTQNQTISFTEQPD